MQRSRASIYEGSRIPSPIPTMLVVPEELRENDDILQVNFGPNHPSTHGVLRLVVDLDGESVVGLNAVIGYLHTGFEKNMEAKTWWKAITYPARIDYLAFQANEYAFVAAIEKLLEIEVPAKATWMRTLLLELNRIHSHLIWLGTGALEIGAISMLWYCFNARDLVLDLFELVGGTRMHTRYFQAGGLVEDIPRGFFTECRSSARDPEGDRPVRDAADEPEDLARADAGPGAALRRGRDRARPVGPGAARVRRRLGHPQGRAVPRLPRARLQRARLPRAATSTTAT